MTDAVRGCHCSPSVFGRAKRYPHVILTLTKIPPLHSSPMLSSLSVRAAISRLPEQNVGWCHCLLFNNGAEALWLGKPLIGRYERRRQLLKKLQENWLLSDISLLLLVMCPITFTLWSLEKKKNSVFFASAQSFSECVCAVDAMVKS